MTCYFSLFPCENRHPLAALLRAFDTLSAIFPLIGIRYLRSCSRFSLRERRTSEGETRRTARHGRHCARARGRSPVSRVLQFPVFVVCLGLSIRRKTQHAQTCLLAVRAILCPDGAGRRHGQCVFSNSRLLFGKRPPPEAGREASRGFPHNAFNFILSQLFPRFRFFGRHTAIPPRGGSGRLLNALRIRQKRHSEPT